MILAFFSLLLFAITLLGFSHRIWWFNVVDFFRLQYACIALLLLCAAFFYLDVTLLTLNALTIGINLFRIRNYFPRFSAGDVYQNKQLLSMNAFKDNHDPNELKAFIAQSDPELMLIMEMTQDLEIQLNDVLEKYPYRLTSSVRDGFSICLFSKNELENQAVTTHGPSDTPLLQAQTTINDQKYQIFCAHPKPALKKSWHQERRSYFAETQSIITKSELPVIVMGDFNAVPWEKDFRNFLKATNLKSTLEGYGYEITWPVFLPILGIPMDHILISNGQRYYDFHVGPYTGSDHYPILLNLKKHGT